MGRYKIKVPYIKCFPHGSSALSTAVSILILREEIDSRRAKLVGSFESSRKEAPVKDRLATKVALRGSCHGTTTRDVVVFRRSQLPALCIASNCVWVSARYK